MKLIGTPACTRLRRGNPSRQQLIATLARATGPPRVRVPLHGPHLRWPQHPTLSRAPLHKLAATLEHQYQSLHDVVATSETTWRTRMPTASGFSHDRRHEPDGSARQDIDRISLFRRLPPRTGRLGTTRHRPHQSLQATAATNRTARRDKTSTASVSAGDCRHEPDGSARQDVDRIRLVRRLPP